MWTTVGISVLAALVNAPLMFAAALQRKKAPATTTADYQYVPTTDEDADVVETLMKGGWVHPRHLAELNAKRFNAGLPFLLPPVRPYGIDKEQGLCELYKRANEDFSYTRLRQYYCK